MAIFKMIEENEASGKVKEVFDDIKSSRGITEIPNFLKMFGIILTSRPQYFSACRETCQMATCNMK